MHYIARNHFIFHRLIPPQNVRKNIPCLPLLKVWTTKSWNFCNASSHPPLPPLKIIARPQKCSVRVRYENGPVGRTSEFTVRVQQLCLKNSLSNMFTYNWSWRADRHVLPSDVTTQYSDPTRGTHLNWSGSNRFLPLRLHIKRAFHSLHQNITLWQDNLEYRFKQETYLSQTLPQDNTKGKM